MNINYLKAMAVGAKLKKEKELYEKTKDWYGSEQCRAFTRILVKAIDFKNEEIDIKELINEVIKSINEIEIGTIDDYAKGYIVGERIGEPNEKNIELAKKCEEIWEKDMNYGYYQEVVNEVLNGKV